MALPSPFRAAAEQEEIMDTKVTILKSRKPLPSEIPADIQGYAINEALAEQLEVLGIGIYEVFACIAKPDRQIQTNGRKDRQVFFRGDIAAEVNTRSKTVVDVMDIEAQKRKTPRKPIAPHGRVKATTIGVVREPDARFMGDGAAIAARFRQTPKTARQLIAMIVRHSAAGEEWTVDDFIVLYPHLTSSMVRSVLAAVLPTGKVVRVKTGRYTAGVPALIPLGGDENAAREYTPTTYDGMTPEQILATAPKVEAIWLTPELAQNFLDNLDFARQRKQSRDHVAKTEHSVGTSQWWLTHEGIAIGRHGLMIDGQHRCESVVKTGVAIPILLFTGVDERAFPVINTGKPRSNRDILGSQWVAICTRMIHSFDLRLEPSQWVRHRPSPGELTKVMELHPELQEMADDARRLAQRTLLQPGVVLACMYIAKRAYPDGPHEEFAHSLIANVIPNDNPHDPVRRYSHWLMRWHANRRSNRKTAVEHLMIYLKVWNAYVNGEDIKALAFQVGGESPMHLILPVTGPPAMR